MARSLVATVSHALSQRYARRDLIPLLAGSLALLAGGGVATARPKKRRFRTKTRRFHNASPITIPGSGAANPYPSEITVSGFRQGKLQDVDVVLANFSHGGPEDVDILLVAPNGRRAVIVSDVGGFVTPATNLTLTLDDQAGASLPFSSSLGSGRFRPTNQDTPELQFVDQGLDTPNVALSTFTGINPNGTWRLYVFDDDQVFEGSIAGGWALTIRARVRV